MFRDRNQDRATSGSRTGASIIPSAFVLSVLIATALPSAARAAEPSLLLLPFVVHSAEAPEYVRDGLSDMLSARFERIGGLELLQDEKIADGTSNLKKALALGRKAGADYVLFGSFTRFGQGASLDVQCAPVAGGSSREPLREIFVHSGSIGEIIPDLDELAGKVSRFARGENILAPPKPAPAGGPAPSATPAPTASTDQIEQDLSDLMDRVAALEASMVQILDNEGETIEIE